MDTNLRDPSTTTTGLPSNSTTTTFTTTPLVNTTTTTPSTTTSLMFNSTTTTQLANLTTTLLTTVTEHLTTMLTSTQTTHYNSTTGLPITTTNAFNYTTTPSHHEDNSYNPWKIATYCLIATTALCSVCGVCGFLIGVCSQKEITYQKENNRKTWAEKHAVDAELEVLVGVDEKLVTTNGVFADHDNMKQEMNRYLVNNGDQIADDTKIGNIEKVGEITEQQFNNFVAHYRKATNWKDKNEIAQEMDQQLKWALKSMRESSAGTRLSNKVARTKYNDTYKEVATSIVNFSKITARYIARCESKLVDQVNSQLGEMSISSSGQSLA